MNFKDKFRKANDRVTEFVYEHRGTISGVTATIATATVFGLALRGQSHTFNSFIEDCDLVEDYQKWHMKDFLATIGEE